MDAPYPELEIGLHRVLRLRLLVGPTAAELHALRWELLCDPDSGALLASSERVLFSRFMLSQDWRPVRLRPKATLRALVAVAAPTDLAEYGLAPVDLAVEVLPLGGAAAVSPCARHVNSTP